MKKAVLLAGFCYTGIDMRQLAVQFLDQGFHRVLFDAMPVPVFVLNQQLDVLEYNSAAAGLLGTSEKGSLPRAPGEILNCAHSRETQKGCGGSNVCGDCVVRESLQEALRGRRVTRQWTQLELLKQGKTAQVNVRVSCQPLTYERCPLVLLVLEGLNE